MRLSKVFCFIVLLNVLFAASSIAFHEETALVCNRCHTMHYSEDCKALPGEGPVEHLLTIENSTELCLKCHDGKAGTPDVMGEDDVNGLRERAAGFFGTVNAGNANGHNLQDDEIGPSTLCSTCHSGGDFSTARIGCIDCHDPHGKGPDDPDYRYRNLRRASSPGSEPLFRAFVKPGVSGLEVYEQENIGYTAPDMGGSDWREVTNICFDCHHTLAGYSYTRYPPDENGTCIRHPSTDSQRGIWEPINRHGPPYTDPEHWKNGSGIGFTIPRLPFIVSGAIDYTRAAAASGTNEVFCLTCHKAHGSRYKNSLRWSPSSSSGCQQCHNKGQY